ncbi:hypothetical protein QBC39DRAFT_139004 [Podospora conica]|nr:hypothetical protein QBC39DRAFT_139004 [Schizothecium conicum]
MADNMAAIVVAGVLFISLALVSPLYLAIDTNIFSLFFLYFVGPPVFDQVVPAWLRRLVASVASASSLKPAIFIFAIAFLAFPVLWRIFAETRAPTWDGPGKVLIFPSRTTHMRLFPKKHHFSYSYLVVGIPVGWEGSIGGLLSVGVEASWNLSSWFAPSKWYQKGWFTVDARDFFERGHAGLGLRGKLDGYLKTQGVDPSEYPHAYLVTAPRFLGYQFNPVSFWYLYDADRTLAAVILEVNNTFGERRPYFLKQDDATADRIEELLDASAEEGSQADDRGDSTLRTTIKKSWPKDFHVSPFNSRKGSYSMTAHDPLSPRMQGTGPVVMNINLVSSKGHGKMVARLFPEAPTIDPSTMTWFAKAKFFTAWWWVGLFTLPRVLVEATKLFFKHGLHVWFRPEPLKGSLGREPDAIEEALEPIFRRYLRHAVEQSAASLAVKYVPPGLTEDTAETILTPAAREEKGKVEELVFKVLTPAFYSRFVYYAHDLEALLCEFQENATIYISRPDLLPKFVLKKPSPPLQLFGYLDFALFKAIQHLRRRPARIERPLTSSAPSAPKAQAVDIRNFRISPMDAFVLAHETPTARQAYRNSLLKLFLADRISFGFVLLLEVQRLLVQAFLAWTLTRHIPVPRTMSPGSFWIGTSYTFALFYLPSYVKGRRMKTQEAIKGIPAAGRCP